MGGLNVIIPLGGTGKRFSDEGYIQPKPLINVLGKSIIFWVLDNIKLKNDDVIFVAYHKSLQRANFEDLVNRKYPNVVYTRLLHNTRGAAETVQKCIDIIPENRKELKTVCLDGDTFYNTDVLDIVRNTKKNGVICFKDEQNKPIYSYVQCDEENNIIAIAEKERISDLANTGCYIFENTNILSKYCKNIINNGDTTKGEYYISMVIKSMMSDGKKFNANEIRREDFHVLGTPYQVKLFSSENKHLSEPMRFCFDLDNTLVSYPKINGDYTTCLPLQNNINYLKYLKSEGHTIIIHTARRMKTWGGNTGSVVADIGDVTLKTLKQFDIPYDEIYFGKPYADFYIDDLAVNTQSNLERETGFHVTSISERGFNNLNSSSIETIRKTSKNIEAIDGERFWYENMPMEIEDLFPRFFGPIKNDNGFEIEKIRGVPFSHMFLEKLVTEKLMIHLIDSLDRIHRSSSDDVDSEIDIYANYSQKIMKRYQDYDYNKIEGANTAYEKILTGLKKYEEDDYATISIIHGDPVFTNIILRENGDFVFIDMRGEIDGKLTLYGDKWYDYAKIYQSILGYDEILLNKVIDSEYRQKIKLFYEEYIIKKFGNSRMEKIKLITNSLYFSLIPLHDNEKIWDFFNLIQN